MGNPVDGGTWIAPQGSGAAYYTYTFSSPYVNTGVTVSTVASPNVIASVDMGSYGWGFLPLTLRADWGVSKNFSDYWAGGIGTLYLLTGAPYAQGNGGGIFAGKVAWTGGSSAATGYRIAYLPV